ncbi:hypothetical protein HII31_09076 [Pseudocercospora fuligena]|uniref:Terpene synthase n=1 Tax=Pseudocercospora fuligena TaxID=685502 RepID=A0A8H6RF89_9PEZI|nr:hypothetical protein HII31_09076 [Pseudocercospora fuligena]
MLSSSAEISLSQQRFTSSFLSPSAFDPLLLPQLLKDNACRDGLDYARLIRSHFLAFERTIVSRNHQSWSWKRAAIEVIAVRKAFPLINNEHAIQAMIAWFYLLCHVDDEVEKLDSNTAKITLQKSIYLMRHSCIWRQCPDVRSGSMDEKLRQIPDQRRHDSPLNRSSSPTRSQSEKSIPSSDGSDASIAVLTMTEAFVRQMFRVLPPYAIRNVAQSIVKVWQFMCVEFDERARSTSGPSPEAYLAVRTHTIGLEPFFTILESLLLDRRDDTPTASYATLIASVSLAVGLQNDIVGLEKDLSIGERLNMILLATKQNEEQDLETALTMAIAMHNDAVKTSLSCYQELISGISCFADQDLGLVAKSALLFLRTHYSWATHSRRYQKPDKTLCGLAADGMKQAGLRVLCYKARMRKWRRV